MTSILPVYYRGALLRTCHTNHLAEQVTQIHTLVWEDQSDCEVCVHDKPVESLSTSAPVSH